MKYQRIQDFIILLFVIILSWDNFNQFEMFVVMLMYVIAMYIRDIYRGDNN